MAYNKAYYEANKERFKGYYQNKLAKFGRAHVARIMQESTDRTKADTFARYGSKCICCGESNPKFLTFDHINGHTVPNLERRREAAWRDARRQGFPDTFRILCFNCNCGRQANGGTCPHEE